MSNESRAARLPRGFVEVFMPLLPGTDDVQVRRLWEAATARLAETLRAEPGTELNHRTGRFARRCGGHDVSEPSSFEQPDPTWRGGAACMNCDDQGRACRPVRRSVDLEPTLVTALLDMQKCALSRPPSPGAEPCRTYSPRAEV